MKVRDLIHHLQQFEDDLDLFIELDLCYDDNIMTYELTEAAIKCTDLRPDSVTLFHSMAVDKDGYLEYE